MTLGEFWAMTEARPWRALGLFMLGGLIGFVLAHLSW